MKSSRRGGGTKPFRGVAFNLSSLGYAVARGFKEALAPFELEQREFALLRAVGSQEGQSQQALGDRLQIPRSRMVSIVDQLEARGLVERRPNPTDRRVRELYLTDRGKELLEQAFERVVAYERQVSSSLDEPEREQLIDLLERISTDLGIGPGAHPALRGGVEGAGASPDA